MSPACTNCEWTDPSDPPSDRCPNCDSPMEVGEENPAEPGP